jgi:hypothetical protein
MSHWLDEAAKQADEAWGVSRRNSEGKPVDLLGQPYPTLADTLALEEKSRNERVVQEELIRLSNLADYASEREDSANKLRVTPATLDIVIGALRRDRKQRDEYSTRLKIEAPSAFFDPWEGQGAPAFPRGVLHPEFEAYTAYKARTIGTGFSSIAMTSLAAVIMALNQSARIVMTRHTGWEMPPRIWLMMIGDPSTKKTPILEACIGPLKVLEAAHQKQADLERKEWKIAAAQAKSNKEDAPDEPVLPTRLIIRDATVEKIAEILSRGDRGSNIIRDELIGFIAQMDRYANKAGGDRPFFLEAYNGGPYSKDRVNGEIFVSNCSLNVIGGAQPNKLKELTDLESDGFLQRMIPLLMDEPV